MNREKINNQVGKLFSKSEEIAFIAQGLMCSEEYPTGAGRLLDRISADLMKITDELWQELAQDKKMPQTEDQSGQD